MSTSVPSGCHIVTWQCNATPYATIDVMESTEGLFSSLLSSDHSSEQTSQRNLFILCPGNPCIVECYREFSDKLRQKHHCDVLVIGYAGHSLTRHNGSRLFSLQDQIDLCHALFSTLLESPSSRVKALYGGRVFLAGHSIGAFVTIQMFARFERHIHTYFGLAPVLSYIKASPNGRRCAIMDVPILQDMAAFIGSALAVLPVWLRKLATRTYAKQVKPALRNELMQRVHRAQLHNIIYMTEDELRMVRQPDFPLLRHLQQKMVLYYVPEDGWAPPVHAEEIRQGCDKLRGYIMESANAHVAHAWCLADNDVVIQNAIVPFLKE